jgi:hypothetical protein
VDRSEGDAVVDILAGRAAVDRRLGKHVAIVFDGAMQLADSIEQAASST